MENLIIKPDRGELAIWFLMLVIFSLPILVACIVLALTVQPLVFSLLIVGLFLFILFFVFWLPAYFKSLEYAIEEEAVRGKKGVFWRRYVTVPYTKITNVDVSQGPVQRLYKIGTVHVQTAGAGGQQGARAELLILGVKDLNEIKNAIMKRVVGHVAIGAMDTTETPPAMTDSNTMKSILEEVTSIRKLLEKE
ncbi:MAG TPA: PH domain-containing protein [Bacteroidetes bacterium]|nr:PH domain-containing protein [Bacteroidota bacterium]